ncbi:MAG: hypothetical protein L6R41_001255 [Letrouitia leprolyta]|nr:MAG: hypothetical protein L6R41_001255 [Letrouitia leprolyta]
MSLRPISLDGRTLEGGGQLLRIALSLSALTYLPIDVWSIRANRAPRKPNQPAGGLKPAHLAAVEWLAEATGADTRSMVKGSQELLFIPLRRTLDLTSEASSRQNSGQASKDTRNGVWHDVYDGNKLIRRDTRIHLNSPGSICLILQAILPYLLFHSPNSTTNTGQAGEGAAIASVPLRVTIEGGTNVSKSPSIEYIDQVLIPMLVQRVGIPPVTIKILKRGWSSGRVDIGAVQFDLIPFVRGSKLAKFNFSDRGEVSKMHVSILAPSQSARNSIRDRVIESLLGRYPEVDILFPVEEDTKNGARLYLLIVAETSKGYRLARDILWDRKINSATIDIVMNTVVKELAKEIEGGGCVDEYMQDQLVVFQALAEGRSIVDIGHNNRTSLHTQTARWVAEQVLSLKFDEQGTCSGCGFEVGEIFLDRESQ